MICHQWEFLWRSCSSHYCDDSQPTDSSFNHRDDIACRLHGVIAIILIDKLFDFPQHHVHFINLGHFFLSLLILRSLRVGMKALKRKVQCLFPSSLMQIENFLLAQIFRSNFGASIVRVRRKDEIFSVNCSSSNDYIIFFLKFPSSLVSFTVEHLSAHTEWSEIELEEEKKKITLSVFFTILNNG